ncbi:MAG TPA: HesA/MoeB/ThiF family protein [Bacteroidales bacterium]|nr:HesA/MoeB/ThiF family protein [Bacteroidales bacterium]
MPNGNNDSNILTAPESRRFQHQIDLKQIGISGQERLKNSKVVVIGAGAIGAQVLQFLAAVGIGSITIVDDSMVLEKDVQVQTLYGGRDLGKLKTIISRQQLQNLYPFTKFDILNLRVTAHNILNFLGDCDLVVDATNSPSSNYIINDACIRLNKSWVYGSTSDFSAELTVFNYLSGPSYRCLYPDNNAPDTKAVSPANVYGVLGSLMANECVKAILASKEVLSGRILNFDLYSNIFVQQTFERIEANFNIPK